MFLESVEILEIENVSNQWDLNIHFGHTWLILGGHLIPWSRSIIFISIGRLSTQSTLNYCSCLLEKVNDRILQ